MRVAPLALAFALTVLGIAAPAHAQSVAGARLNTPAQIPDETGRAKLIWATMLAIDDANLSGNYSVLRDTSAPDFQQNNDPAKLAQIFAGVRAAHLDLSNTLLLEPTYSGPPEFDRSGLMRLRGAFGLRPVAILFDLGYQWVDGRWRLYAVSIGSKTIAPVQPDSPHGAKAR